jgi:hypothetical protein
MSLLSQQQQEKLVTLLWEPQFQDRRVGTQCRGVLGLSLRARQLLQVASRRIESP